MWGFIGSLDSCKWPHSLSYVLWVFPEASSWRDKPETLLLELSRRHLLCPGWLSSSASPCPATQLRKLISPACILILFFPLPKSSQPWVRGGNVDRSVNQELCLFTELLLHHDRPVQRPHYCRFCTGSLADLIFQPFLTCEQESCETRHVWTRYLNSSSWGMVSSPSRRGQADISKPLAEAVDGIYRVSCRIFDDHGLGSGGSHFQRCCKLWTQLSETK